MFVCLLDKLLFLLRANLFESTLLQTLALRALISSPICLKSQELHIAWSWKETITFSTSCAPPLFLNYKVFIRKNKKKILIADIHLNNS